MKAFGWVNPSSGPITAALCPGARRRLTCPRATEGTIDRLAERLEVEGLRDDGAERSELGEALMGVMDAIMEFNPLLQATAETMQADRFTRAVSWVLASDDTLRAFLTSAGWDRSELSLLGQHSLLGDEPIEADSREIADDPQADHQAVVRAGLQSADEGSKQDL